jgi:SAM-dependent methyltransferase
VGTICHKENTTMDAAWQASTDLPPALALRQLIFGHRVTQLIATAGQLGLADQLNDTPQRAADLAPLVQADVRALQRLLRALASVGVVAEVDQGCFTLTPVGACLRTDASSSIRSWVLAESAAYFQQAWGSLLHAVQTGTPAFDHALGMTFYQYLAQHPDAGRSFGQAMAEVTAVMADAVVAAYDFAAVQQVVDVGGGYGTLLATILQAYPSVRGVLFDIPAVIEGAGATVAAAGVADRCELIAGDFFERVPAGGEAYLLSRVLMDYDDDRSVQILRNCRRAMAAQGRVLIIQLLLPRPEREATHDLLFEGAMSDLNMLILGRGAERSEAEYRTLLEVAGFRVTQVIPTRSLMSIVEGRPA